MNILVFSRNGIHFADRKRGEVRAIYVPSREQVRRFTDIGNINSKSVKERYGDVGQTPLWRQDGGAAVVYGLLLQELSERRHAIEVFLPEDYVPEGCSVFYFIFGDRWIIHGVRSVSDDGVASWGSSRLDAGERGVVETLVGAISERVVEGVRENICVAVHHNAELQAELAQALEPLGQEVVRFDTLSIPRDRAPLYVHRDHGLLFIVMAMVSLLLFAGAAAYAFSSFMDLRDLNQVNAGLEAQIHSTKDNRRLGNVRNPNLVLDFMSKPLKQKPSSIIDAAARAAGTFGQLKRVEFETSKVTTKRVQKKDDKGNLVWTNEAVLPVQTVVEGAQNYLLVDQERIAKTAVHEKPWVRYMERQRSGALNTMAIEVGVAIE